MIGFLQGTLYAKSDKDIIVLVNGVGYKVEPVASLLMVVAGEYVQVYIYTHVREDAIKLFGFASEEELKVFEMLLSVSGVGPKGAMNIVSTLGVESIYQAIIDEEAKAFKGVSGIGAKNAEKIILELKGKIGKDAKEKFAGKPSPSRKNVDEVEAALLALGYSIGEIKRVESEIQPTENVSDMVREGLKLLNGR